MRDRTPKRSLAVLAMAVVLVAAACSSDDGDDVATDSTPDETTAADEAEANEANDDANDDDTMADEVVADEAMADEAMADEAMVEDDSGPLNLDFEGLEPLASGVHYEGWVIVGGEPISTGNFNVDDNGSLVDLDGNLITAPFSAPHYADAEAVVITIEPANDTDPAPSATKILGGPVVDGTAELGIAFPAALGTDFVDASGRYVLATPTTAAEDDEFSGVWFIDLDGGGAIQGLDLPALNDGWVYEGWAVIDGQPVSTGRFIDPAASDDSAIFSGPDDSPPFPGEDFIINAPEGLSFPTDLRDGTVVISVEPADDDSPAPFALKPLVSEVADGIGDHDVQEFGTGPVAISGTATIG